MRGVRWLVLLALFACKEEEPKPPVAGELPNPIPGGGVGGGSPSPNTGDGGTTTTTDAGACTDLPLTGAPADSLAVADNPPSASAGTLADGTFDLVQARSYTGLGGNVGPTGVSYASSVRLNTTTGRFERITSTTTNGNAPILSVVSGTLSVGQQAGSAVIALSCPNNLQEQVTYSVVNDNLTLTDVATRVSFTYQKRL